MFAVQKSDGRKIQTVNYHNKKTQSALLSPDV